jgi:palmitoyl-protein thioesterase
MHNLITFGSQHMGVSDMPTCKPTDFTCKLMERMARSGVYSQWSQDHLIQAQYYRDPKRLETYLAVNKFLPDVNGELAETRNESYAHNLAKLDNLVLVLFAKDVTVVPKESAWFGSEAPPSQLAGYGDGPQHALQTYAGSTTVPMRLQPLYVHDWIGLRTLDEQGKVHLETCDGPHMHLSDECWIWLVKDYCGGEVNA